jgi:protein-S-isoprenylcysteine O-methyltransferase Ste14
MDEKTSAPAVIKPRTLGGVGPRLALLCLPYVVLSLLVMNRYPEFFTLKFLEHGYIRVIGFVWLSIGFVYWVLSAIWFLKFFKTGKLIVSGPLALCRNPIYSSMILFIIPSFGIIFHSGLIFSIALVLYIGFKISIHGESTALTREFGSEYEAYVMRVNEIIPFPRHIEPGNTRAGRGE